MVESESRRIYLDHAATSFPKSPGVGIAMLRYLNDIGVAAGRGATRRGAEVQRVIDHCRQLVARQFGLVGPERVIFTLNGTDSLNLAIHGLLRTGDRVVTTVWEHNSVLRPLHQLQREQGVTLEIAPHDGAGRTDLDTFRQTLRTPTRLVVLNHASNVTGVIQPVEEMAEMARAAGAIVLLDAAQTAGVVPVSCSELPVDLIACPGHKGLGGPLGTGLLLLGKGVESELVPVRQGGTGSRSESPEQPLELPDRYEAGNLNAPGLFGLDAALQQHAFPDPVDDRLKQAHFLEGLQSLPGTRVLIPDAGLPRLSVFSVCFDRVTPPVMASLLDEHFGIETRAGLHCAPLAHQALGTLQEGGTVRFSFGSETTRADLDDTLNALAQITASL